MNLMTDQVHVVIFFVGALFGLLVGIIAGVWIEQSGNAEARRRLGKPEEVQADGKAE